MIRIDYFCALRGTQSFHHLVAKAPNTVEYAHVYDSEQKEICFKKPLVQKLCLLPLTNIHLPNQLPHPNRVQIAVATLLLMTVLVMETVCL